MISSKYYNITHDTQIIYFCVINWSCVHANASAHKHSIMPLMIMWGVHLHSQLKVHKCASNGTQQQVMRSRCIENHPLSRKITASLSLMLPQRTLLPYYYDVASAGILWWDFMLKRCEVQDENKFCSFVGFCTFVMHSQYERPRIKCGVRMHIVRTNCKAQTETESKNSVEMWYSTNFYKIQLNHRTHRTRWCCTRQESVCFEYPRLMITSVTQ